jgi:hypothetical protein
VNERLPRTTAQNHLRSVQIPERGLREDNDNLETLEHGQLEAGARLQQSKAIGG